jgi:hypothetical protein
MKRINIEAYADQVRDIGGMKHCSFYSKTAANQVIKETPLLEHIGNGEHVTLHTNKEEWSWLVKANIDFYRPILERIYKDFGIEAIDLVSIDGRLSSNDVVQFKRKMRENEPPQWGKPHAMLVPDINTQLRLTAMWEFDLFRDSRNSGLIKQVFGCGTLNGVPIEGGKVIGTCKIAKDAVLKVDRVYIRKGAGEFSSITFRVEKGAMVHCEGFKKKLVNKSTRFWARLGDVNTIRCRFNMLTVRDEL